MSKAPFLDRGPQLDAWFDEPTRAAWVGEATRLARGRSPEALATPLPGGVDCPILFTAADLPESALGVPDLPPFRRGAGVLDRRQAGWDVRACVDAGTLAEAAVAVRAAIVGGARSVWLVPDAMGRGGGEGTAGLPLRCEGCLDTVLEAVDLGVTPIHISPGSQGAKWMQALAELAASRGVGAGDVTGAVPSDPAALVVGGMGESEEAEVYDQLVATLQQDALPWVQTVGVSSMPFASRGADPTLELGCLLASGAQTLRALHERGVEPGVVAPKVLLQVSAGRDTFAEIAKLRAVRWLWSKLLAAWGVPGADQAVFVQAVTSPSLLSRRDPWVNLLRGTHGAFCAAVAGADAITVLPWDRALGVPSEQAHRVSVTSQAVLEAEAHLARVADPAGGSWYVEWLTDQLARGAWARMQAIEAEGGLSASWRTGTLRAVVDAAREEQEAAIARRSRPVLGVSIFPNPGEDAPQRSPAPMEVPFREAAAWEALRDAVLGCDRRPVVWLATLGSTRGLGPRLDFARQLIQSVGLEEVEGPLDIPMDADVVLLCGTDAAYAELLDGVLPGLAGKPVVLAGRPPPDREASWHAAGLDHAIYAGADVLSVLVDVLGQVGVKA